MLELWVLVLMLGRLLEIVVAVLRKLLHDLLSGFHFESFLFEDLIGSCGPLHRLLVECRVGVVNWRVPSRHGLPVELLLDWSLAGVSLGQHPVVVIVYVLSLLANHPLGRRHHRHQVLSLHDGRGRHSCIKFSVCTMDEADTRSPEVFLGFLADLLTDPSWIIPSCSSYFLFMVEFQWFLIALSVRPGMSLAILAHWFPHCL